MNKRKMRKISRLNTELLLAVIVCLMISGVFFTAIKYFSDQMLDIYYEKSDYLEKKTDATADKFQEFVTENGLKTNDFGKIKKWVKKQRVIILGISLKGKMVFDSTRYDSKYADNEPISSDTSWFYTYKIRFGDKTAKIYLLGFYDYEAYTYNYYIDFVIAGFIFVVLLTLIIRKKLSYISQLDSEIQILEGGNLDYNITIKGRDELTTLAERLDSMRVALKNQMESEHNALTANKELITALSHDLRTPLTTQLGYLEILKEKHYNTPEEQELYINKCVSTCEQIKNMSNRLFEYFLVYNDTGEEKEILLEKYDGLELFLQHIYENTLLLEEKGYRFEISAPEEGFAVLVNMDYICRIFNNIFSNISKYAEAEIPIKICIEIYSEMAAISFCNAVKKETSHVESTKIGLNTIKRLMDELNGSFKFSKNNELFLMTLDFPIYKL